MKIKTQQKRELGICACVGAMVEYADDNEDNKEAYRAYTVNLSTNTDKTSNTTLEHLYASLKQLQIHKIISNRNVTKLEMTRDNAPCYVSRYFLYGAVMKIAEIFVNLKLIR